MSTDQKTPLSKPTTAPDTKPSSAPVTKRSSVLDSKFRTTTAIPHEVTVTTSGNIVVNVTELLGTDDAKRQIDALKELASVEQKK